MPGTPNRTRIVELADIYVGRQGFVYSTGAVNRKRGKSTVSSLRAAQALADKLFGPRLLRIDLKGVSPATQTEHYLAQATPEAK